MTIHYTLGEFRRPAPARAEFLKLTFTPANGPLQDRGRNKGRPAALLGDCLASLYLAGPAPPETKRRRAELRPAVAYVSNELIENAMKFHDRESNVPLSIRLEMDGDTICVSSRHAVSPAQRKRYLTYIHGYLQQDTREHMLRRMQEAARDDAPGAPGIGLLTMTHDYAAQLGWRFETSSSQKGALIVTTQAQLSSGGRREAKNAG